MKAEFWSDIQKFSGRLKQEDDLLVVSHHDADGVTACAIIVDLLKKLHKKTEFMILKQLDSTTIGKIADANKTVVLTDLGSGQLSLLEKNLKQKYYIIDHHVPEKNYELQVNPHPHGYDGGIDVSASCLAYFVAKSLGFRNMSPIAIVGAVGDMQDSNGKLHSLNRIVLNDGVEDGSLKVKNDLRLFGRQSRPLNNMLAYSSDPLIPGLIGNPAACTQFISDLGINPKSNGDWRNYVDLSFEERKKLTTALYIHLLNLGKPEFVIQRMIGEVYTLLNEEKRTELRDAKEFATLMNACGRQSKAEIGVEICLGDRGTNLDKARDILQKHRKELKDGLEYLQLKGVESLSNLYYFDAEGKIKESIVGVVAGMGQGTVIPPDKPVLGFAEDRDDKNFIKVSARGNWDLIRKGIHLGNAMRDASSAFGGEGGGHDIAAGARVPKDKKQEFMHLANEIFKKQLHAKK